MELPSLDLLKEHLPEYLQSLGLQPKFKSSIEIAELMGKPRGTISKWVCRAVRDGRIRRKGNWLTPPEDVFGRDEED